MAYGSSPNKTTSQKFLDSVFVGDFFLIEHFLLKLEQEGIVITDVKDSKGLKALHLAVFGGHVHSCKYLIEELNFPVNVKDEEGKTPLYQALVRDHHPTILYLLEVGADPNISDDDRLTPLHLAAMRGNPKIIRLLISKGALVDAETDKGTPLLHASSLGHQEAMKILLEHNANPNRIFNHMHSPLVMAILTRSFECVRILLEANADPNSGPCGATPFEIAVSQGDIEIVEGLLNVGANPNVINPHGESPIETAALNHNSELIMMLLPVTTPIPKVRDWSYSGIIRHVYSNEVRYEGMLKRSEYFMFSKTKGEEEFKKKNYFLALYWYTEALGDGVDPNDPVTEAILLSNRSLCYAKMNRGVRALADAQACLALRPDWPKAYYRVGVAWNLQKRYRTAADAFREGLKLDTNNKELQTAFWEATRAGLKGMGNPP